MRFWNRRRAEPPPSELEMLQAQMSALEGLTRLSDDEVRRYGALAHRRDLLQWRASDVVAGYRTIAAPDACSACLSLAARRFRIDDPLPLPHPGCTHLFGCRCSLVAILDVEWEE